MLFIGNLLVVVMGVDALDCLITLSTGVPFTCEALRLDVVDIVRLSVGRWLSWLLDTLTSFLTELSLLLVPDWLVLLIGFLLGVLSWLLLVLACWVGSGTPFLLFNWLLT